MTPFRNRGFTMTELVAVLIIVAILAVSAASVIGRRGFDTASFADQARVQIAYAQKVAVAARRSVTVTVAANAISLTMCADATCATTVPVPSPQGEPTFVRTAPHRRNRRAGYRVHVPSTRRYEPREHSHAVGKR